MTTRRLRPAVSCWPQPVPDNGRARSLRALGTQIEGSSPPQVGARLRPALGASLPWHSSMAIAHGYRPWHSSMALAHGIRVWHPPGLSPMAIAHGYRHGIRPRHPPGIRTWHSSMAYIHGHRPWLSTIAVVHSIRAWRTLMASSMAFVHGTLP